MDGVIQAFKRDVDRTLLRENLKLTPEQRIEQLMALIDAAEQFRAAGRDVAARCRVGRLPTSQAKT